MLELLNIYKCTQHTVPKERLSSTDMYFSVFGGAPKNHHSICVCVRITWQHEFVKLVNDAHWLCITLLHHLFRRSLPPPYALDATFGCISSSRRCISGWVFIAVRSAFFMWCHGQNAATITCAMWHSANMKRDDTFAILCGTYFGRPLSAALTSIDVLCTDTARNYYVRDLLQSNTIWGSRLEWRCLRARFSGFHIFGELCVNSGIM